MAGQVGASLGSNAASCAFMDRLDALTTAVYPHELPRPDHESKEQAPFPLNSFTAVFPVLIGMGNLTIHVFRPYVVVGLFVLAGFGVASIYCAAAGACLLAYLFLFDERFLQSERQSSLPPGLHCRPSPRTDAIVSMVSALRRPHYKGTPWIVGGDLATLYPFLAFGLLDFTLPVVRYTRRWLAVDADHTKKTGGNTGKAGDKKRGVDGGSSLSSSDSLDGFTDCGGIIAAGGGASSAEGHEDVDDKEAVALDIALPEKGLDPAKPFYVVLHGLTGGSAEPYVLDFVRHALGRGCGVCVMISRGCMATPVRGYSIFHGARISDARSAVQALRRSLPEQTPLAMIGYSMGGIIAMNYVALSGANSGVSCCVSMAGSLDTRTNMGARHSQRVWQPILARALKEHFVVNNESKILARGLDISAIERCKNVLDIDTHLVAPYNGYPDVTSYYEDMSAAADGKIAGLRTPTLAVSSLDDPIMTGGGWPSTGLKETKDLFVLLTRKGGHVGWPTGWFPTRNRWGWMSTTSLDFCEAVVATAAL